MLNLIVELIPALSGGILGLIPSFFKQFTQSSQQKRDNAHEIAMLELSYKLASKQKNIKIAEQELIYNSRSISDTLQHDIALGKEDGLKGFLRATVRPICTYAIVFPLAYTLWQATFLANSVYELSIFIPPDLVQFSITSIITFWFSAQAMKSNR